MQHPYCYPGTDVYQNKEDIRDSEDLEAFERHQGLSRLESLPHDIPMTPDGYQEIHRYLLQDVYDWAGQIRDIDISRTGPFCRHEYIEVEMDKRFAALSAENDLRGLDTSTFAERAAEHIGELNAIHPFVDGNGRTLRAFLEILGEQAGHEVDLVRIDPDRWNHASAVSFHSADNSLLSEIISEAIVDRQQSKELENEGEASVVDRLYTMQNWDNENER